VRQRTQAPPSLAAWAAGPAGGFAIAQTAQRRASMVGLFPPFNESDTMNKNQVKGTIKDAAGKVQEAAGKAVGSTEQQAKGLKKQVVGQAQKAVGDLQAVVKDTRRP
jgi:uncharacterized protein YjbJ (UPF0337 family)